MIGPSNSRSFAIASARLVSLVASGWRRRVSLNRDNRYLVVGLQEDDLASDAVGAQLLYESRNLGDVRRPIARVQTDADIREGGVIAR